MKFRNPRQSIRADFQRRSVSEIESRAQIRGENKKKGKGERPERWEIVKFFSPRLMCVCVCQCCWRVLVLRRMKNSSFFHRERFLLRLCYHIALEYSHFLRLFNSEKVEEENNDFVSCTGCSLCVCECEWGLSADAAHRARSRV